MTDPLSLAHRTFCDFVLTTPKVKKYIRGNYDDYTRSRGGTSPDVKSESNLPWLRLELSGGPAASNLASNASDITLTYNLQIISGDQRLQIETLPAAFAVYCAVVDANRKTDNPLRTVQWELDNQPLIRDVRISNVAIGKYAETQDASGKPAIKGSTSVCTVTLYLDFTQTALQAWAAQT